MHKRYWIPTTGEYIGSTTILFTIVMLNYHKSYLADSSHLVRSSHAWFIEVGQRFSRDSMKGIINTSLVEAVKFAMSS